jgi:hypothetical protein
MLKRGKAFYARNRQSSVRPTALLLFPIYEGGGERLSVIVTATNQGVEFNYVEVK